MSKCVCGKSTKREFCSEGCWARHYREVGRYDTQGEEIRAVNKFLLAPVRA
jgi:hypothetical protein